MTREQLTFKHLGTILVVSAVLSAALAFGAADTAHAGVAEALQQVIDYINSKVARSLAILAVMMLGIGWWFGQVDWQRAGGIIFGIGVVFGAAEIVDLIKG
jgi:type IV secretory pathway VirB2 component (pilin)